MKAILLAAGTGSRIAKDIGEIPKSMLEVGGQPLLLHTVDLLQKNHMEVVIITGYQHRVIEGALADRSVRVYYNPFFKVTNSIGSLWCAREELGGEDLFIANADVYYTQELLDIVFASEYDNFLLEDRTRADVGDYFFLSRNGILEKYGKDLPRDQRSSEYVGIGVLRNAWVERFRERLCAMIEDGKYNLWWENVLHSFVGEEDVHTVDVNGLFWAELDTIGDYRRVQEYCGDTKSAG